MRSRVIAVGVVAAALAACSNAKPQAPLPPQARVLARIELGSTEGVVSSVVSAAGAVWVAAGRVYRVDPATNAVTATIDVREGADWSETQRAVFGNGSLWVPYEVDEQTPGPTPTPASDSVPGGVQTLSVATRVTELALAQIDGARNEVTRTIRFSDPRAPVAQAGNLFTAFDRAEMWVAADLFVGNDRTVGSLYRMDGGRPVLVARYPHEVWSLAWFDGWLWSTDNADVLQIKPTTGAVVRRIPVGSLYGVSAIGGALWARSGNRDATRYDRVDPATGTVVATLDHLSSGQAAGDGSNLWVADDDNGPGFTRVDLASKRSARFSVSPPAAYRKQPFDYRPTGLDVGAGSLWVLDQRQGVLLRVAL